MFSFFRKSQDAKKSTTQEKETDGFVFLGQTPSEQRTDRPAYPGSAFPSNPPFQIPQDVPQNFTREDPEVRKLTSQNSEGNSAMAELLNDIPFILAPHVQEVQNICREHPQRVPIYNLEENFAQFHYDFSLENSVLCGL
ncbi:UBAP1-MVB12-associated (UMA)-domain containing protein 1 isoform 1-T2 [Rhinophrynus dorsalis]